MKQNILLLRIAGGLALFTFLGHTAGTFMPVPPEQVEVAKAEAMMKATMVPMPFGNTPSYAKIFLGTNLIVSLYLVIAGFLCFFLANAGGMAGAGRKILVLNSIGLIAAAGISAVCFFPLPAICTGLAGILGIWVASRGSSN